MKDTTFWPSQAQAARIATSYKPAPGGKGLAATTIGQLRYPLTDRRGRFPMPAGGLFSTARDVARFYRMLLNGGRLDGKRYLSESAVKQMTSRQTPAGLKESYGFGLAVGGDFFGHGGAYSTNTIADTRRGLILVWLVQHAGFAGKGAQAQGAFRKAAIEAFAPPASK
jgi:CubicO group peptidase (beta-lactamase class C family)